MDDEFSPFSEEERRIFSYFDGTEKVFADPVRLHRRFRMALKGKDLQELWKSIQVPEPPPAPKEGEEASEDYNKYAQLSPEQLRNLEVKANQSAEFLFSAISEAFEMPPLDKRTGKGATEPQMMRALTSFLSFLDDKKKAPDEPPKTSLSTETVSSEEDPSNTLLMSAYG